MIEVKNLVKKYGDKTAVDHLSFTLEPGRIYGLLGPNGAGKSTTMNIMTGYLGATEGEVIIDGHNIVDEPEIVKKKIGYLPEIPPLYADMTVNEYLAFAAELKEIPKKERAEQIEAAKNLAHVKDVEGRLIRNLSKGYKQRVGLAYAVLGLPDIIILDEPTVGMDPKQIIEIRDVIKTLAKDHTVILSSHILTEVSEVCDYVLIISSGKLVASDTIDNLYKYKGDTGELHLTVKGASDAVEAELKAVSGITEIAASQNDDFTNAVVHFDDKNDTLEAIFYRLADAKLPIYNMSKITKSLEEMFLELTDAGNTVSAATVPETAAEPVEEQTEEDTEEDTEENADTADDSDTAEEAEEGEEN